MWYTGIICKVKMFHSPATILVNGSTSSGKSTFCRKLIQYKEALFTVRPIRVHYYYGIWQPLYETMPGVDFHEGLPDTFDDIYEDGHILIVLDDLLTDCVKSRLVEQIFLRESHHRNASVCLLSQNVFCQGKTARNLALNTHYLVLFRSLRDGQQMVQLGAQIFPGKSQTLVEAYKDAVKEKYNYLLIDLSPHSENVLMKSKIFPDDPDTWIYQPL